MPDEKFSLPFTGVVLEKRPVEWLQPANSTYQPQPLPAADWQGEIIRPDDLLYLCVSAYNLRPQRSPAGIRLTRVSQNAPAILVYEFPPQAIAEQAYYEASNIKPQARPKAAGEPPDPLPAPTELLPGATANARVSRPSRLVFRLADGVESVPLSPEDLLDWEKLEPVLAPLATFPLQPTTADLRAAPAITGPGPLQTALELPYRLFLSPNAEARWLHSTSPVNAQGRIELWHTRLAQPGPGAALAEASAANPIPLRAIWSPDYHAGSPPDKKDDDPDLGTSAMNPNDRHQIVTLTSAYADFQHFHVPPIQPSPIEAQQLMLSALGGWLRSRGHWDLPEVAGGAPPPRGMLASEVFLRLPVSRAIPVNRDAIAALEQDGVFVRRPTDNLDLTEWVHAATQGRDHYVRLVYDGCLFPLGHRASLVKVTERRFEEIDGAPVALLRQFMYVVVREPERDYPRDRYPHEGREMPLTRIRIKTLVTPHLFKPDDAPALVGGTDYSFWMLDLAIGLDVPFEMVGFDAGGRAVPFSMPLIFVRRGEAHMEEVRNAWRTTPQPDGVTPRRQAMVNGAPMDFAPGGPEGDNSILPTRALYFDVVGDGGCGEYLPTLFKASVTLSSVEQLVGRAATTPISLFQGYLDAGFDASVGLFARIEKDISASAAAGALGLQFSAEQAGGIATPNVQLTGLSTRSGPVAGDLADAVANTFDPKKFFGGLPGSQSALLFGAFSLTDLFDVGSLTGDAPAIETHVENDPVRGRIAVARYTWLTVPKPLELGGIVSFVPGGGCEFTLEARVETALSGNKSGSSMQGSLRGFQVEFFKAVTVRFTSFTFQAPSGQKLDVNVALDDANPISFGGDLDFVQKLSELIPPGVFGDGPSLDLRPDSVALSFDIGLPPLTVGVFALKNLGLNTGLRLPFLEGRPLLDFGFARRESPFLLTVSLLGGGGFFHLQLDTSGIRMVEAALEFGASVELDIGVASGNVHVFAGIYFKMESRDGKTQVVLTGYLRMGGALSVLGIVTISVEFNLSFTYESPRVTGRATLTVNVEVACFSKSVELAVERSFGRDGGDPAFGDLIHTPGVWVQYADAFA